MAIQGKTTVLHELFVDHHRHLLRIAGLLVDDPGSAEEVVQEAYLKLAGALPLRDPGAALPYLRKTVVNLSRSRLRRRRTADRHPPPPPGVGDPADVAAIRDDDSAAVLAAVRTLAARQQQCLVLRYYAGMTDREVADAVGISLGSAKTHLRRGLAALAVHLEDRR